MGVNALPLIDISNFQSGNFEAKRAIAAQVAQACTDIGFFAISGHGVEKTVISNLRESSHTFFSQSDDIKHNYVHPIKGTPRGFRKFRGEALGKTSGQADAQPDLKEFYHIGREKIPLDDPYYTSDEGKKYFIPNLWPDHPLEFKAAALAYWDSMEALAMNLAHIIAVALDLPETWFDDKINKHATAIRLNYYPAFSESPLPEQIRAGAHTDYGMITILMGENQPGGLQILTREGHWIDVETKPDYFVINIGDLLMRWTNDTWLSNLHRVTNPPTGSLVDRGRFSAGFFFQPNYDALIECIPTCLGPERPAKYKPVHSGRYREVKYEEALS